MEWPEDMIQESISPEEGKAIARDGTAVPTKYLVEVFLIRHSKIHHLHN